MFDMDHDAAEHREEQGEVSVLGFIWCLIVDKVV